MPVSLNEYAKQLLNASEFNTKKKCLVKTIEIKVKHLGFLSGANTEQLYNKAYEVGLVPGPISLAPHLRLEYLEQSEEESCNTVPNISNAPPGSITVASTPIVKEDEFPKGFYLRSVNGTLWLRGYAADELHIWEPDSSFIFVVRSKERKEVIKCEKRH
nr:helicase [Alkalicoccus daliensis]